MPLIIFIILSVLTVVLQLVAGDFPVSILAFPLNVVLMLLYVSSLLILWNCRRKSGFVRFLLTPTATYLAIGMLLLDGLVIGLTGFRWIIFTWPSVFAILYFQTVLIFVILRGWREKTATGARLGNVRWRFFFLHAGLLITVMAGFWGAPDTSESRVRAYRNMPVSEAFDADGSVTWLKYEIELKDFNVVYGQDGIPSDYSAEICIGGEDVLLKVNHPYSRTFSESVYLNGYDVASGPDSQYVILQIVKDPWRYGKTAGIVFILVGALLLFAGGPRRRYGNEID